jgi:hypothetical protein
LGTLELHDEIDGANVDSQFERARGDERAQVAGLESLLEHEAALPRE